MTLKRLVLAVAAIALMGLSAASAKADSVTYTLDDVSFSGQGTATGSFSFDFTTDTFTAIDIAVTGASGTTNQTFTLSNFVPDDFSSLTGWCASGYFYCPNNDQFTLDNGNEILYLGLALPTPMSENNTLDPLVPDTNGFQSDLYYNCSNDPDNPGCSNYDGVAGGSLLAGVPTPTPEPSTLLLLTFGVAGMLFVYAWRRKSVVALAAQA